jgi:hypothetical protein
MHQRQRCSAAVALANNYSGRHICLALALLAAEKRCYDTSDYNHRCISLACVARHAKRVLMCACLSAVQVAPWSKTGGLGDVVGGLPIELAKRGHKVITIAPRYAS